MRVKSVYFVVFVIILMVGIFSENYRVDLLATALTFGLFAASVDLSWGYCGVLNLGSALYFAIGSYTAAYALTHGHGLQYGLFLGMGISLIVSFLLGSIGLRIKASQIQYGLMGLVLSLAAEQVVLKLYDITGGDNGISNVPHPAFAQSSKAYFLFVYGIVVVIFFLLMRLAHGPVGKVMICVREDEDKAETMGYDPLKIKLSVSLLTAVVSSIAGSINVPILGIAVPGLFGIIPNMLVLVWVAIGGQGTLVGPFLCAVVLKLFEFELGSNFQNWYVLFVGILFVLTVVLWPREILSSFPPFLRHRLGMAQAFQTPRVIRELSVSENLLLALNHHVVKDKVQILNEKVIVLHEGKIIREGMMSTLEKDSLVEEVYFGHHRTKSR